MKDLSYKYKLLLPAQHHRSDEKAAISQSRWADSHSKGRWDPQIKPCDEDVNITAIVFPILTLIINAHSA
jgi:hypothetical protein